MNASATIEQASNTLTWTDAACATGDARLLHLFFSEDAREIAEAKAICSGCRLRTPCLEGAIERAEPWGVWGGQLFDKGQIVSYKRGRGRPRKDEALRNAELERQVLRELASEVA